MTYSEKLKDPRWQKKRLEVLQRDNFTCCICKNSKETLHIHHKTYIYDNNPWDYSMNNFITLCKDCHEHEEQRKSDFNGSIHDLLLMGHTYGTLYEFLDINYKELINSSEWYKPKSNG